MKFMSIGSMLLIMVPALTAAASVDLVAFADKPFCEKVVALFGEHLDLNAESSKTVQWEPVQLKGQGPPTRRCSSFDRDENGSRQRWARGFGGEGDLLYERYPKRQPLRVSGRQHSSGTSKLARYQPFVGDSQ